ncbi:hypothetical protein [Rhodococcus sp. LB1]|uniref:hypothetical protein n=1 Tax=Rhodococcus sp. LB1 TaxID=1807499 RepID=UPI00077ADBA0|nr:hypothetical protein [Rhodococcus sp. LB1]KXX55055.1 hypothetical protein AZG88_20865 [Rhodococcus sp. LB1]
MDVDAVQLSHSARVFAYSRDGITVGPLGFQTKGRLGIPQLAGPVRIGKQHIDQRAAVMHADHIYH